MWSDAAVGTDCFCGHLSPLHTGTLKGAGLRWSLPSGLAETSGFYRVPPKYHSPRAKAHPNAVTRCTLGKSHLGFMSFSQIFHPKASHWDISWKTLYGWSGSDFLISSLVSLWYALLQGTRNILQLILPMFMSNIHPSLKSRLLWLFNPLWQKWCCPFLFLLLK